MSSQEEELRQTIADLEVLLAQKEAQAADLKHRLAERGQRPAVFGREVTAAAWTRALLIATSIIDGAYVCAMAYLNTWVPWFLEHVANRGAGEFETVAIEFVVLVCTLAGAVSLLVRDTWRLIRRDPWEGGGS